jgi:hypothetical protein
MTFVPLAAETVGTMAADAMLARITPAKAFLNI